MLPVAACMKTTGTPPPPVSVFTDSRARKRHVAFVRSEDDGSLGVCQRRDETSGSQRQTDPVVWFLSVPRQVRLAVPRRDEGIVEATGRPA